MKVRVLQVLEESNRRSFAHVGIALKVPLLERLQRVESGHCRCNIAPMKAARLLLLGALALPACRAAPGSPDSSLEDAQFRHWLVPYLQAEYRDLPPYASRADVRYGYALVDLSGDGINEALVYVAGGTCGTGGCGLEVLERAGTSWRTVTSTSIGYAPVQVLAETTHGWRDLAIYSRFDAFKGHHARLRFDGRNYPYNPSVPPAEPMPRAAGDTVIADAGIPLFAS